MSDPVIRPTITNGVAWCGLKQCPQFKIGYGVYGCELDSEGVWMGEIVPIFEYHGDYRGFVCVHWHARLWKALEQAVGKNTILWAIMHPEEEK